MSAFNSNDFPAPGLQQDSYVDAVDSRDPSPLLFTAKYSTNRITLLFSDRVLTASTTTSNYTLTGPSAPAISSVVYTSGARRVDLYLSGALSLVGTYTIAIADRAIASYNDASGKYQGFSVNNQSGLVVTVILPTSLSITGVGIEQDIVLGTPNINTAGAAVAIGIEQDIGLGVPVANTLTSEIGVGIEQDIVLGTPVDTPHVTATATGVAQLIGLGTPIASQEQEPLGVGFVQSIALGTPVADINPLTPTGVGVNQPINLGTPVTAGPANAVSVGINQTINVGASPTAHKDNTQDTVGVGIGQIISVGTPAPYQSATLNPSPFNQPIAIGFPVMDPITPQIGVGVNQPINLGIPVTQSSTASVEVGIAQIVDVGLPLVDAVQDTVGVGIDQPIVFGAPIINHRFLNSIGIEQDIALGLPISMTALTITVRQHNAFTDLDAALQKAYADGVEDGAHTNLMDPIGGSNHDYRDDFTSLQQHQTKVPFENLACAMWVAMNIPGKLSDTDDNAAATLAKLAPTGLTGSLTFVDGILVSKVDPLGMESDGEGIAQAVGVGTPGMSHT